MCRTGSCGAGQKRTGVARRRRAQQRRRKERRAKPDAEERLVTPPPAPVKRTETAQGVSWLGLIGALMGLAPMLLIASAVLEDPPEVGRALAIAPLLMALAYLPAVWASVARTERRQPILRGSVVVSLIVVLAGSFVFGFPVLVALAPATALLWLASGGPRPRR